jgi:plasmid maintenance system antidote protein VapI
MVSKIISRRGPGRPATGQMAQMGLRLPEDLDRAIELWMAKQSDVKLTKPEAIRRLLREALTPGQSAMTSGSSEQR